MSILIAAQSPNYSNLFNFLCSYGEYEHAKKIYSNHRESIKIRDNLFNIVCIAGHITIAQWLYEIHFDYMRGYMQQFVDNETDNIELDDAYIFASTCASGQIEVAKWLFRIYNVHIDFRHAMYESCAAGQLEIVKWLWYEIMDILKELGEEPWNNMDENNHEIFQKSCRGGLAMAQWVYSQCSTEIELDAYNNAFTRACKFGNLDVAQWIYSIETRVNPIQNNAPGTGFCSACSQGNTNIVVWLINTFPQIINDEYICSCAFRSACSNGHLEIAKLLLEKVPNVDVQSGNYYSLRWACYNGHIEVAKWLYELYPSQSNTTITGAFDYACSNRKTNIIRWLNSVAHNSIASCADDLSIMLSSVCSTGDIYVAQLVFELLPEILSCQDDVIMVDACRSGKLEFVKWIYEKFPTLDIMYNGCEPFYGACKNGSIDIAEWLIQMNPTILEYVDGYEIFSNMCKSGDLEGAKWSLALFPQMQLDRRKLSSLFAHVCRNNLFHMAIYLAGMDEGFELVVDHKTEHILKWKINLVLPIKTPNESVLTFTSTECCICYEPPELQTNCGHVYCTQCAHKWYNIENKSGTLCPYCRTNVHEFYRIV